MDSAKLLAEFTTLAQKFGPNSPEIKKILQDLIELPKLCKLVLLLMKTLKSN